ncbi:DUF218 containing protein [Aureococcus anophagefferens]|nr:DUF218 containing protein [Aureococcus anophagefferens]
MAAPETPAPPPANPAPLPVKQAPEYLYSSCVAACAAMAAYANNAWQMQCLAAVVCAYVGGLLYQNRRRLGEPPVAWSCHDVRVADKAVELYDAGMGFSGGFGAGPHSGANLNGWTRPEADVGRSAAGVPEDAVLVENAATNTGENCRFSAALLDRAGRARGSLIVVQKPFMEKRSYATLLKQWPGKTRVAVTSPSISFMDYPDAHVSREAVVSIMVGDLQRLRLYATPERDFQAPVAIPDDVWAAYEGLVAAGYDGNVPK